MDDREVVAAIAAGDPAGIAVVYDRYAAPLYGYCHWALGQPADAIEALRDTFVKSAATLGDLPEALKLRPWLYAMARNECQRRLQTTPADHVMETREADRRTDAGQHATTARQSIDAADEPTQVVPAFRAIREPTDPADEPTQVVPPFRAIREPTDPADQASDATLIFRAIREPTDPADEPTQVVPPFRAIREPTDPADQASDATLIFCAIREPIDAADGMSGVNADPKQADLATIACAIFGELNPREREAIELNLRHDLHDTDLATVLGVSESRARALVSRALGRVEDALAVLLIVGTGREACPELNTLLANWDGRLTEQTQVSASRHLENCTTCASRKSGVLRPEAISGLLPLADLPPGLREQILPMCSSATPDLAGYRQRQVRRAESARPTRFLPTIRRPIWRRAEGSPRAATIVPTLWIAALWVVGVTLLIFTNPHSSHASAARPSMNIPSSSPAAADVTPIPRATPTSASPSPSSAVSPSRTYKPRPSALPTVRAKLSPSRSPKPSKSPSPSSSGSPSHSASPPPSRSPSPSPSPSQGTSTP